MGGAAEIRDVNLYSTLEQEQEQALALPFLDTLLAAAPVGVAFLDRDLRFVRINERLAEINGSSVAAHLGKTVAEIVPTLEATVREVTARILATGQPVLDHEFTGETARAPGIPRTWNESWYPVRDDRGEIVGFSAMVEEITERKQAEAALRLTNERFELAVKASKSVLWQQDLEMRFTWLHNPAPGIDGSDAVGKLEADLLERAEDAAVIDGLKREVIRSGVGIKREFFPQIQGVVHCFEVMMEPIRDAAGNITGLTGAASDITERKQIELALSAAKSEAERANQAKSDFLLRMSHELRSPLHAMLGFAQMLEAGKPAPTPAQQARVQQILHAGWYLLKLVNEVLDLTAIESGKLVLALEAVALKDVLDDCRAMIEPKAQAAGVSLHFSGLDQSWLVQADAIRTKQVLLNLLTNAIKYNRNSGSVAVRCAVAPGQRVRVSVEDTGPGLSVEQIAQLFQPFNRIGQETGGAPGTGIGLVISKRLVNQMGGRIGVESEVGAGSCFWFELDAAPAQPARRLPVRTVLCIENDANRLQHVEELAAQCPGVGLLRARDICGGVEIARSSRPDAIVMGIPLLNRDAVQAVRLLAKDPATAHIPVIVLAADTAPLDIEAGREVGCFDYLTQPVRSDAFARALELAFQRSHGRGPRAAAQETA